MSEKEQELQGDEKPKYLFPDIEIPGDLAAHLTKALEVMEEEVRVNARKIDSRRKDKVTWARHVVRDFCLYYEGIIHDTFCHPLPDALNALLPKIHEPKAVYVVAKQEVIGQGAERRPAWGWQMKDRNGLPIGPLILCDENIPCGPELDDTGDGGLYGYLFKLPEREPERIVSPE